MANNLDLNTFSIQDIINAYKNYDTSEETKEIILYFVSELTGLSIDAILEQL